VALDGSSPAAFLAEADAPRLPQDHDEEAAPAKPGGNFLLADRPLDIKHRGNSLGWRIGFWSGFVGLVLIDVFYVLLGFSRAPWADLLGGALCGAPAVGFIAGLIGMFIGDLIATGVDLFGTRNTSEERALETAMDDHDRVGRKWGEDAGDVSVRPEEDAYYEEDSPERSVQTPEES
jgi:hypothetical protein